MQKDTIIKFDEILLYIIIPTHTFVAFWYGKFIKQLQMKVVHAGSKRNIRQGINFLNLNLALPISLLANIKKSLSPTN